MGNKNALHYVIMVKISIIAATIVVVFLTNSNLKHHLDALSAGNVTYTSRCVQNEVIADELIKFDTAAAADDDDDDDDEMLL